MQAMLVQDDDVIQTFAVGRADEALDIGVLPGRSALTLLSLATETRRDAGIGRAPFPQARRGWEFPYPADEICRRSQ